MTLRIWNDFSMSAITKQGKQQNSSSLPTREENPHGIGWFTSQRASDAENLFILWRHHHVVLIAYNKRVYIFHNIEA